MKKTMKHVEPGDASARSVAEKSEKMRTSTKKISNSSA
jgi:hypothetical protein